MAYGTFSVNEVKGSYLVLKYVSWNKTVNKFGYTKSRQEVASKSKKILSNASGVQYV